MNKKIFFVFIILAFILLAPANTANAVYCGGLSQQQCGDLAHGSSCVWDFNLGGSGWCISRTEAQTAQQTGTKPTVNADCNSLSQQYCNNSLYGSFCVWSFNTGACVNRATVSNKISSATQASQNSTSTEAMIERLKQQLAQLQEQVRQMLAAQQEGEQENLETPAVEETPSPAMAYKCHTFLKNLSGLQTDPTNAEKGIEVNLLQMFLEKEGFAIAESEITQRYQSNFGSTQGYYGVTTKQAVKKFQEKYASEILTPLRLAQGTGSFSTRTREKMNQLYGCASGVQCTSFKNPVCAWDEKTYENACLAETAGTEIYQQGDCAEATLYPALRVTAPARNEILDKTGSYNVAWDSVGFNEADKISIWLFYSKSMTSPYCREENNWIQYHSYCPAADAVVDYDVILAENVSAKSGQYSLNLSSFSNYAGPNRQICLKVNATTKACSDFFAIKTDSLPTVCTPNWQCGDWGTCYPDATCGESTCAYRHQTRTCTDLNACGVATGKPTESQSCGEIPSSFEVNLSGPIISLETYETYDIYWTAKSKSYIPNTANIYLVNSSQTVKKLVAANVRYSVPDSVFGTASVAIPGDVAPGSYRFAVEAAGTTAYSDYYAIKVGVPNCADSDSGQNFNAKGTTTYKYRDINQSKNAYTLRTDADYCIGDSLVENYCEDSASYPWPGSSYTLPVYNKTVLKPCQNGCLNGACKTACTPKWDCTAWGYCTNSLQTRTCTDAYNCQDATGKPAETQSCSVSSTSTVELGTSAGQRGEITVLTGVTQMALQWKATNVTSCYASGNWSGSKDASSGEVVQISGLQSIYTLTCYTPTGTVTDTLKINVSTCTPNWQCSSWSACLGSLHTRTCTDSNNCGTTIGRPPLDESCSSVCTPYWECTDWSECSNNSQDRICTDKNNCGNLTNKPTESQYCVEPRLNIFSAASVARGKTLAVSWIVMGVSTSGSYVRVMVDSATICNTPANSSGNCAWTVPSTMTIGTHTLKVSVSNTSLYVTKPFSVTVPTTTTTTPPPTTPTEPGHLEIVP